jgi:hypothetical protein
MLCLAAASSSERSVYVESRRSLGRKRNWPLAVALRTSLGGLVGMGTGGTGMWVDELGDCGVDAWRLVTPGMYAIWITLEARVRTVVATDATVCVDALDLESRIEATVPGLSRG